MAWTDERIEKLTKMWEGGATASQIADELGGVSRNAVIGKAHRLGLKARPSPVKAADKPAKAAKKKAPAKTARKAESEARPAAKAEKPAPKKAAPKPAPEAPIKDAAPATDKAAPAGGDASPAPASSSPRIVSVGPGGFLRQGPSDQQPPIPPAPPRRLVPAKPSPEMADKTGLLDLNDRICRWPMGHPGEPDFHFCGEKVNPGFPYCVEHCGRAYQAQLPRGARRPPPPLPFGGPRVR
jgi:GcrA cell cycle regulator